MKTCLLVALLFLPFATACNQPFGAQEREVEATARPPTTLETPAAAPTDDPPTIPQIDPPTSAAVPGAMPRFVDGVDHPYFPLIAGRTLVYEGDDDGALRRDEVTALPERVAINGVACTAMAQEVYLDGELAEVTTEWFAQDEAGHVWKFGEESFEIDGGEFVLKEDSWTAGIAGAHATIVFAAEPGVGDVYFAYNPQDGLETLDVVALDASAIVPAGAFANCIELVENAGDAEESDTVLYAPGVGLISEKHSRGKIVLVDLR